MSSGTENKSTGSFYTPEWCVDLLLEMSGFSSLPSERKLSAKIIDPACGDGSILRRTVESSLSEFAEDGVGTDLMESWVRNNIVGIELDPDEARKCRKNLIAACSSYGISIPEDELRIVTGDAFEEYIRLRGSFDYVIGNPPYVRIHNLDEKPPSTYITGMCDLYYAFFDIGQQLLADGGKLCYIAPSSWMTNEAASAMRRDLEDKGTIRSILDFGHYQVFDNATTYTAIVVIGTDRALGIDVWKFDESGGAGSLSMPGTSLENLWCRGKFYPHGTSSIQAILDGKWDEMDSPIKVRNGYATLCDKAYVVSGDEEIDGYVIDVVKASRGKRGRIIYPYDDEGNLIPIDEIRQTVPKTYERLRSWKEKLLARNKVDTSKWWGYGRSQGIVDTYADKVTAQSIVQPGRAVVTTEAPAGCGVYSGLYVLGMSRQDIDSALADPAFMEYVRALAKYKSGGYYTFSGKELQRYLRWWATEVKG